MADPILTTREISVLFWVAVLAIWAGRKPNIRPATINLLETAFNKHLRRLYLLILVYSGSVLWALAWVGLWGFSQWKSTLLWILSAAPFAAGRAATAESLPNLFRKWAADTFKLAVLIELIATSFTFSLWIELLLVPALAFLSALWTFARLKDEYAQVKAFLDWVLTSIGFVLVLRGLHHLRTNWNDIAQVDTLPDLYTVPLLALCFIPFAYAIHIFAQYELAITRLRVFVPDNKLRDQAMARAIIAFGPRITLLQRWVRSIGGNRLVDLTDINASIRDVLKGRRREKLRPAVSAKDGWCPVEAGDYLSTLGFKTKDYHRLEDEWFAASRMVEINDALIQDNLAYYVEGDEAQADTLKLKLNVNTRTSPEGSEARLFEAAETLMQKAGLAEDAGNIIERISSADGSTEIDDTIVVLEREDYPNQTNGGYSMMLRLMRGKARSAYVAGRSA